VTEIKKVRTKGPAAKKKKSKGKEPLTVEAFQQVLVDECTKKFGESDLIDVDDNLYGIPLDGCLPLQYLFGIDIVPLERAFSVVGPTGSWKSMLTWWFIGKFMDSGGLAVFLDVERKTNWDQVWSLIGDHNKKRLIPQNVGYLEDMQEKMQLFGTKYDSICPQKDVPFIMAIDSIGALTSEAVIKLLKKEGNTDKGYAGAKRAAALTEFFRAFLPEYIYDKPLSIVMVNHQKIGMTEGQGGGKPTAPTKNEPGGVHKDYMGTYILEMSKQSGTNQVGSSVVPLTIRTKKSSLSRTGLRVALDAITEYQDGEMHTFFDWDSALVRLLTDDYNKNVSTPAAREITGITASSSGNKWTSAPLGLKDVTRREMGKAIHENEEMVTALQDVLRVSKKRRF
jgi:hypothetical protein